MRGSRRRGDEQKVPLVHGFEGESVKNMSLYDHPIISWSIYLNKELQTHFCNNLRTNLRLHVETVQQSPRHNAQPITKYFTGSIISTKFVLTAADVFKDHEDTPEVKSLSNFIFRSDRISSVYIVSK